MSSTIAFDIIARDRASDKFDKVGNSAEKSSGKLKKFAKIGAAGFAAVGAAAIVGGKYAFQHGAKLEQMAMKADTVFGGQIGMVEKWSKANASAMGLSNREATGLAANFADLLIPMGFARNEAAKMSTKVVGLSGALSQWSGGTVSAAEASDVLAKAMLGERDGLKALGISISDADVKAELLRKGQDKLTGAALQQATASATQTLIMQKSTDAQAAFAKGGSPLLTSQAKLSAMFKNVRDELVMKLVPIMGKAADWATTKLGPALSLVGDWVKTKLLPPIRDFAEKAAPKARDIMAALKGAFQDSKPLIELVGKVLTNVVVPAMKKLLEVAGPVLAGAIRVLGKVLRGVGEAGTWMWNNALQPAFQFLVKGIGWVLDGFSAMLDAMGEVPGFGWAEKAAVSMGKAADKAYAVAEGIRKIPNKKVTVTVAYMYTGRKGGVGSTRGGEDDPSSYLPKMAQAAKPMAQRVMEAIADGMKAGGKKLDKVLDESRTRIKGKLGSIRDEMRSLSGSIASALTPDSFSFSDILAEVDSVTGAITTAAQSALQQSMAQLTGTNSALTNLTSVFGTLKDGASKGFLSSLMQSGNTSLMQQYAADPAALAEASRLYDANAAMASGLGDDTAQAVLGDRIDKALERELGKLLNELKDAPGKTAKKLRDEIKDLRIELTGASPGQRAYLRGAN